MASGVIYYSRIWLIRLGKVAPFVLCSIVLVSYIENIYSLFTQNYIEFDDGYYLNKPISWAISKYVKYDFYTMLSIGVLSFAIETCKWNKLAIVYLGFQLLEKHYFATIELDIWFYFIASVLNAILCAFFVYKGVCIIKMC